MSTSCGSGCWRFVTALAVTLRLAGALAQSPEPDTPASFRDQLSEPERATLAQFAEVRVGATSSFLPIYGLNEDKALQGIAAEYLEQITAVTGIRFKIVPFASLAAAIDGLRAADAPVDMLLALPLTPANQSTLSFTRPYLYSPVVLIGRRGMLDVNPSLTLSGKRVAVAQTSAQNEFIAEHYPNASLVEAATTRDAIRTVIDGQAELVAAPLHVAQFFIEEAGIRDLEIYGELASDSGNLRFAVPLQKAPLAAVFDRALQAIPDQEKVRIRARWLPVRSVLGQSANALLSADERNYLKQLKGIRVGYDRLFAPYTHVDRTGALQGIAGDYLAELQRRLGVPIKEMRAGTWAEVLSAAERGELDVLIASATNRERRDLLDFVGPYAALPSAIVSRIQHRYDDLGALSGKRVAILKRHFLQPMIHAVYPTVQQVEFDDTDQTLLAVLDGQVDAAIGNLDVVARSISERTPGSLMISGTVHDGDSELYLAVRKNLAPLAPILRKGMDSLSSQEHAEIRRRWTASEIYLGVPWRMILAVGLPIALALSAIFAILIYSNQKLRSAYRARKAAETEARAASEQKTRFIAMLSHEVRTPLAALMSATDVIDRRNLAAGDRRLIGTVSAGARGLLDTLDDLLTALRGQSQDTALQSGPFELRELLAAALQTFSASAQQKDVALELQVAPEVAQAHECDGIKLTQILTNLLSNALKYTDRGKVELSARLLYQRHGRQRIEFEVADTGAGMSAHTTSSLFNPFGGVGERGGSGLGLSIARQYVEAMGGKMQVQSTLGQGSRFAFSIELPVTTVPPRRIDAPAASDESAPRGATGLDATAQGAAVNSDPGAAGDTAMGGGTVPDGGTDAGGGPDVRGGPGASDGPDAARNDDAIELLLVDDNRLNGTVYARQLEQHGYSVEFIDDPGEALSVQSDTPFALVLVDAHMPQMNGTEFIRRLRAFEAAYGAQPAIVVGLTADLTEEIRAAMLAAGANAVLAKPIDPAALAAIITGD